MTDQPGYAADCGITFPHNEHLYFVRNGEIKPCDGSVTKRIPTQRKASE